MSSHNGDDKSQSIEPELLTAYALRQLGGSDSALVESHMAQSDGESLRREVTDVQALAQAVASASSEELLPPHSPDLRIKVLLRLGEVNLRPNKGQGKATQSKRTVARYVLTVAGTLTALLVLAALFMPASQVSFSSIRMGDSVPAYNGIQGATNHELPRIGSEIPLAELADARSGHMAGGGAYVDSIEKERLAAASGTEFEHVPRQLRSDSTRQQEGGGEVAARRGLTSQRPPYYGGYGGEGTGDRQILREQFKAGKHQVANDAEARILSRATKLARAEYPEAMYFGFQGRIPAPGTEQYAPIYENPFLSPLRNPLSTFSIDVDTAAYANVRRFLNSGRLPPVDSVRIEELVNYFKYDYPQPKPESDQTGETHVPRGRTGETPILRGAPFSVTMDVAECPWRAGHWLLRVGLKGRDIQRAKRPPSNLVFLLDVSGSMADANKLPLLKTAMKMLAGELGEDDRVSIVTYAGEAGLRLPPTRGDQQRRIIGAIDSLAAGGSTNGSAGIELAYQQAEANFIEGGANRVILCTDGDLNVGVTSDEPLVKLIKQKAKSGTFLTVLGFGEGNLKDAKLEGLADNGNGLYAYIDSVREARKVLVEQLTGSTITIAKDVKIQIEFNPRQIAAYRLLGYENRVLAAQDFNNDKKDAGEIGAGHTVTVLYELVPAGPEDAPVQPAVDALKYQQPGTHLLPEKRPTRIGTGAPGPSMVPANDDNSGELLTLKLRYKEPDGDTSKLLEYPLAERAKSFHSAPADFQFAAAVANFGMILRHSQYRGESSLAAVAEIASAALGPDEGGYRAEFVDLVRKAEQCMRQRQ